MSTILAAPPRNTVLLAKEIATLDSLSNGRVVLGLGLGGRSDDYEVVSADYEGRGQRLEEQVRLMRRIWNGESVKGRVIGPKPVQTGGPELLIGAGSPAALRRAGRLGDGFISIPNMPEAVRKNYDAFRKAWHDEGRSGEPRMVGAAYYALGDEGTIERGRGYLRDYYAYTGDAATMIANSMLSSSEAVRGTLGAYADVGMDEVVLWPCVPDLDQLERVEQLVA